MLSLVQLSPICFLASGGVINWAAGASNSFTHSANTLTIVGSGATTLAPRNKQFNYDWFNWSYGGNGVTQTLDSSDKESTALSNYQRRNLSCCFGKTTEGF